MKITHLKLFTHTIFLLILTLCINVSCAEPKKKDLDETKPGKTMKSKIENGRFVNLKKTSNLSEDNTKFDVLKRHLFSPNPNAEPPTPPPVSSMSNQVLNSLRESEGVDIYRLGHASILIRFGSDYWLIDPVFSKRASPFSWAGPKRFHKPPISLKNLPEIRGVIISHNHYDHLDKKTVKFLKDKVEFFILPLKLSEKLASWGVEESKLTELDWWEDKEVNDIDIVATPAQHFSGRGLFDGDKTLWNSYVITYKNRRLFFSGDSGYFDGFKKIGEKFGPFDIVLMECGGYDDMWKQVHMHPQDTIKASKDLGAKMLIPVHNGTFNLSFHDWHAPFTEISTLAKDNEIQLLTPKFGERISLERIQATHSWWERKSEP